MKVLHLGKFYPPATGGIETHVQTLARCQSQLGVDVQVICTNHADITGSDVTWKKLAKTETNLDHDGTIPIHRMGRIASIARLDVCPQLIRKIRELQREVDILHLHTPNPTMLLALVASGVKKPLVITHHSDIIRQRFLRQFIAPFDYRIYKRADRIIQNCPVYMNGSKILQKNKDCVVTIPMGIDLKPFLEPETEVLRLADDLIKEHGKTIWLIVGRLNYYKGVDTALHALRDVPGKLLIIGTGPLFEEWKNLAATLRVNQRVEWKGHVNRKELLACYHAATAFWFPSNARSEAYGLVQVEAMASRCPVINTAILHSGVQWVSRHKESGLTVPVNDPKSFAFAANQLLEDEGLRQKLGQTGRDRAIREFDQITMAKKTVEEYQNVLGIKR